MTARSSQMKVKQIKESLSQLNTAEILEIDNLIHERLETEAMMKMGESGFSEWEDPEEDIYNDAI